MTAVLIGGGIAGDHWTVDRRGQADRSDGEYDEHLSLVFERTGTWFQNPDARGLTSVEIEGEP
jgi:hypothetical protein